MLGLVAVGQQVTAGRALLECRVVARDGDAFCRGAGPRARREGRRPGGRASGPFGWRPTRLLVRVSRYRCVGYRQVWRQVTTNGAEPRAKLSRAAVCWALVGLVVRHLSVARVALALAVAWTPRTTPSWPKASVS